MTETSDENRARPSRLGRGLSALLGEVEAVASRPAVQPSAGAQEVEGPGAGAPPIAEIAIDMVRRNPAQPRRTFSEEALNELAESVRLRGILQPVLVRPDPSDPARYQIIAGERRWRAARIAGLQTIPVVIRKADELELLEIGIIENVQRSDLNPIEEAEAYDALIRRFGRTQESLATSVGKSRSHITNTLRLLQLPEAARSHIREGRLTAGHARAALGASDPGSLLDLAADKGLSVREVEILARQEREPAAGTEGKSRSEPDAFKDLNTEALEADISRTLGLDVDIRHGRNGGHIRIFYRDLEQLDEVCRRLTAKRRPGDT